MGATASTSRNSSSAIVAQASAKGQQISQEDVCKVLMPVYYTSAPLEPDEKEKLMKSWKLISSGQAPEFWRLKKVDPEHTPCISPVHFFGQRFINRFLEIHPAVDGMFNRNAEKQGPLFYRMIAFTVAALDDETKFESNFTTIARAHNRMGVRAVECKFCFGYGTLLVDANLFQCVQMASSASACSGLFV